MQSAGQTVRRAKRVGDSLRITSSANPLNASPSSMNERPSETSANSATTSFAISPQEAQAELARRSAARVDELARLAKATLARRHLIDFTTYTKPDYEVGWHHHLACRYLDAFARGKIKRLMIFMPPRHGKSELVSRRLPAYLLGRNPNAQVIACSYSDDLASRMNRDVQRIIDDRQYRDVFADTTLYGRNVRTVADGSYLRNSTLFEVVDHKGSYRSAGIGGGITGMGFHYGIIDDPIKNDEEAASKTIRNKHWEWYTGTFYTRREENASILITLTRWHDDDLAGRLLKLAKEDSTADQWTILNLPAIAEAPQMKHDQRTIGGALWPRKYGEKDLARTKVLLGNRKFAALYQQRPRPDDGNILDSSKLIRIDAGQVPKMALKVRRWDLAFSDKQGADFVSGALVGIDDAGRVYILHMKRLKGKWPQTKPVIIQAALDDGADVGVAIEANGTQLGYYDDIRQDRRMVGRLVVPDKPEGSKEMRASIWGSRLEDELIYVVRGEWNQALFDEMDAFPNGEHDDQVDAISGAVGLMAWQGPTDQMMVYDEPVSISAF